MKLAKCSALNRMEVDLIIFEVTSDVHGDASHQLGACQAALASASAESSALKDRVAVLSAEISDSQEQASLRQGDPNTASRGFLASSGDAWPQDGGASKREKHMYELQKVSPVHQNKFAQDIVEISNVVVQEQVVEVPQVGGPRGHPVGCTSGRADC